MWLPLSASWVAVTGAAGPEGVRSGTFGVRHPVFLSWDTKRRQQSGSNSWRNEHSNLRHRARTDWDSASTVTWELLQCHHRRPAASDTWSASAWNFAHKSRHRITPVLHRTAAGDVVSLLQKIIHPGCYVILSISVPKPCQNVLALLLVGASFHDSHRDSHRSPSAPAGHKYLREDVGALRGLRKRPEDQAFAAE